MSRLYWKIFLAFWLVIITTIMITVVVNNVVFREQLATTRFNAMRASLDALTEQAQRALDERGEAGLRDWLTEQRGTEPPLLIVDPARREVFGRPLPRFARRALRAGPGDGAPRRGPFAPVRPQALIAPDGAHYELLIGRPGPGARGRFMNRQGRMLFPAVLVLVSGLACFLLARYLTRPVRVFREAGQRIAAGDLSARVGSTVGGRSDEFGALARDFDRMAERIEQLIGGQERLLRDVSHELRSPLARLQAATDLIRQRGGSDGDANLSRIEAETRHLDGLIGQILQFSRLTSTDEIARRTEDVGTLLRAVVDDARFEGRPDNRDVTLELSGTPMIAGDAALIRSALDNVVRNALQHSVRLTNVTAEMCPGDQPVVRIRVGDDGPGVPAGELGRLFDAFYTGSGVRAARGAGIGLAIARRAVELHGGRISAANGACGGLVVEIELPAAG